MKRFSFILTAAALVWMAAGSVTQDIDYRPKLLLKTLKKHGVPGFEYLQPIPVPHHGPTPGKFFEVTQPDAAVRYVYVGRVNSCRAGGCSQPDAPTAEELEHEYFDYFILFDAEVRVRAIRVYNYAASYGYEITAPGWLRQFIGYDGSRELAVGKDVDAITGATVSVYAITADVEAKTHQLKEWLAT
ncbi:MAG: FMN-binding protein, partial [Bacteroidetes bacterium]